MPPDLDAEHAVHCHIARVLGHKAEIVLAVEATLCHHLPFQLVQTHSYLRHKVLLLAPESHVIMRSKLRRHSCCCLHDGDPALHLSQFHFADVRALKKSVDGMNST